MNQKVMVLLSGGLDSSVMLMKLREANDVAAIFFDRGQTNLKSERAAVHKVAARAQCHLDEIDLKSWWSATGGKVRMLDVPRNPIFALLASPFAIIESCRETAIGSTLLDAKTGDSNAEFIAAFNQLIKANRRAGARERTRTIVGFVIGTIVTYHLDPQNGRERRRASAERLRQLASRAA